MIVFSVITEFQINTQTVVLTAFKLILFLLQLHCSCRRLLGNENGGTCHDDLRACAVAVIPGLIDSVNATGDKAKVSAMFNFTIQRLFQALSEEQEMDVVKTIAQSIKETILAACRPAGK